MNQHELINGLIMVVVVALIVVRQFSARQVNVRQMVIPFILVGYGLFAGALFARGGGGLGGNEPLLDPHHVAASVALLLVGVVVAVALGVWRAMTMRVWRDPQGALWRKGTAHTAVAWIVSIAVRVGLGFGAGYLLHVHESTGAVMVAAGVTLLTQNLVAARRADHMRRGAAASVAA